MYALFLLFFQASQYLPVSGSCQVTLENAHSATNVCKASVPPNFYFRIRQISAYCKGPIDRQIRTVRLETRLSNSADDLHTTFLNLRSREIRTPEVYAEYTGSQLADIYSMSGTRISAAVTASLGAPEPPITCEIRFQGRLVR